MATLYAFLFAAFVGVVVQTGIYLVKSHRESELAEVLSERRDRFKIVKQEKEAGNLISCLRLIEDMGYFYTQEYDMRDFKDQLVYDIRDAADQHLERGEYEQSLVYYNQLSEYAVSSTVKYMLKTAKAYQGLGDYKKTLETYQVLRMYGYENASFLYDLANLYEVAGNPEQALNYYQRSAQMAAAEYEVTIGKAYTVVINAEMIPKEHFDIYLKVSEMHLALRQYEEAIRSVAWSKEIWADSLQLYAIEAKSYQALGQQQHLKKTIRQAKLIDPNFTF